MGCELDSDTEYRIPQNTCDRIVLGRVMRHETELGGSD
jgi:hypothetical protein